MPSIPLTKRLDAMPIEPGNGEFSTEHGAVLEFFGVVREMEDGRALRGIRYSCYEPMAWSILNRTIAAAQREFGEHGLHFHHRLGLVPIGEPSVVIRVASGHSPQAFELCHFYLHAVKKELPIWKEPVFADDAMPTIS